MGTKWTEYGKISAQFQCKKLKDLCLPKLGIQTGPFGSQLHKKDYVDVGTPIITVEHLQENRISHVDTPMVSAQDRERLRKYSLQEGDIVFSRVGSVDRRSLVRKAEDGWLFSGRCLRVRADKEVVDPAYLSYFFGHEGFKNYIRSIAVGATMPSINTKILSDIPIYFPPIGEQKFLAHILGSLDDKIELNRQMNETLEAMTQALFKSWFVDFDPVIDNALAAGNEIPESLQVRAEKRQALGDQRKPLPPEIQSCFPDRFVFTDEMGWIPEGWETQQAEAVSEKIGMGPFGSNIKVSTFVDMGVPVISGKHLNKTLLTDAEYNYVTEEHAERLKNSIVKAGDIIFTHAGNIGQVSLIPDKSNYSKYVISQRQFYLRPDTSRILSSYLVYFFRSPVGQHKLLANASQVGVPSIARPSSHLKSINLLLPSYGLLREFDKHCKANFEKLISNQRESETLSLLRDALLPRLLSGELGIPDAEKQVAEAV